MNSKASSKILKLPRKIDPVLNDDKITIINIPITEDSGDVVYNDVMNVEEFLEEHNIRMDFEELRPQPIIKKRRKLYAADSQKDELYWERREKNNVAVRRSREARRLKENQIALRVAHLERENDGLRQKVESAQCD